MDTLAHGLYGAAILVPTKKEKWMVAAGAAGMLPDLITQSAIVAQLGLKTGLETLGGHGVGFPLDLVNLYYWTHSFFPILGVGVLLWIFKRKYAILVLPYMLHIFFDIFTHCGLFGTHIFYPLSNWSFCGVDYAESLWFWEINYGVIVGIYYLLYLRYYKPFIGSLPAISLRRGRGRLK